MCALAVELKNVTLLPISPWHCFCRHVTSLLCDVHTSAVWDGTVTDIGYQTPHSLTSHGVVTVTLTAPRNVAEFERSMGRQFWRPSHGRHLAAATGKRIASATVKSIAIKAVAGGRQTCCLAMNRVFVQCVRLPGVTALCQCL